MIGKKVLEGMIAMAGSLASFGWRPLEAHFVGKKKQKRRDDKA